MQSFDFGIKNLPSHLELVGKKLNTLAPNGINGLDRILASNGKKLRPSLVIAVAHYSGKKIDGQVITAATAVELVHIASLVHDDIMDGGTVRHGVATINTKDGANVAIIAGDYLLAKGCALACQVSAEAGIVLSETIAGLCTGQALELADSYNLERTSRSLIASAKGKTSALFVASCSLGGLTAGLSAMQLKALADFAESYGVAYQLLDDVRDFLTSPALAGKSIGNDIKVGNYTLPVILSLQGSNAPKLKNLLKSGTSTPQILKILQDDKSIDRAIAAVGYYKEKASYALDGLENKKLAACLRLLTEHSLSTEVSKK